MVSQIEAMQGGVDLVLPYLTLDQHWTIRELARAGKQVLPRTEAMRELEGHDIVYPATTVGGGTLYCLHPATEGVTRSFIKRQRSEHLTATARNLSQEERTFLELFCDGALQYDAPPDESRELMPYDVYSAGTTLVWHEILEHSRVDEHAEEFKLRQDAKEVFEAEHSLSFARSSVRVRSDRVEASGIGGSGAGLTPVLPRTHT